ncbi:MAG: Sec-independent protein translocase protein TatA [Bacillariaceae sp.]|jgi:Sec-independent protein translocase protein TatA
MTMRLRNKTFVLMILNFFACVSYGFLVQQQQTPQLFHQRQQQPKFQSDTTISVLNRQRRSVANIQTMGIFGLGLPEIGIILVVAGFIIGPEGVGNMIGGFTGKVKGDLPDELKKIPDAFQKGFEESTENSKARNAKQMEDVPDKKDATKE